MPGQLVTIQAPTLRVITVEDAKLAARIDGSIFDAQIDAWIVAAAGMAEQECNRWFRRQTRRAVLTGWPEPGETFPVHAPTGCEVSHLTASGWVILSAQAYRLSERGNWCGLAPVTAWPSLPQLTPDEPRVRVDLTAGPDSQTAVPEEVKQYVRAHVALWADRPEAHTERGMQAAPWLGHLLDPLRIY